MMVPRCVAIAFLLCSSASALRISKEEPLEAYVPYKSLPQYTPDHIPLFAGCPTANPKVAILVAGRASGMVNPSTVQAFRKHTVDFLHSKGAQGLVDGSEPDVFIHVKTGEGEVPSSRDAVKWHSAVSREMCEETAKEMGATNNVIEDGWGPAEVNHVKKRECFVTAKQRSEANHVEKEAGYWHSIQGVFTLMAEHEKKNLGKEYDIVIFSRPDVPWRNDADYAKQPESANFEKMELEEMIPAGFYAENAKSVSCQHGHIWGDKLMVIPRGASKPFLTLYDDLALSEDPKICGIDRNEDIFWRTSKALTAEGFAIDWTMAKRGPNGF